MNNFQLLHGHVLEQTRTLADASVDCVITSPPYWQLRDYGYPEQWGLEPTFQEYLEHLWSLMDELWRVLKPEGTAWINLGDTYARGARGKDGKNHTTSTAKEHHIEPNTKPEYGGLDKTLLLIPHRFAIGCIDRGWIVRNDIIWAKRNGMPESVTDRFSKKHEYFFLMAKNPKYYFDLESIRDEVKIDSIKRSLRGNNENKYSSDSAFPQGVHAPTMSKPRNYQGYENLDEIVANGKGKNPGDVADFWDIPTRPSSSKHYATYNTRLIEKPIKAGCPVGGVILDPFCGTGTTGASALRLERNFIGIDGSAEYLKIAQETLSSAANSMSLFAGVSA